MSNNPMGTNGFAFVEYSTNKPEAMATLFTSLGFVATRQHATKNITLYQQGNINFILNVEPDSFAASFSKKHGPCASSMAFRVENADQAYKLAIKNGARPYENADKTFSIPAIYGIGDSLLYLVDNDNYQEELAILPTSTTKFQAGLLEIDHLTHNVSRGKMDTWADYYAKIFNFKQIRFFDIQGKQTGLTSRALGSPCGKIKIPLNESKDDQSQIEEYLKEYNGEGIQHIALTSNDIYKTIETLRQHGSSFLDTPDTYYELLDKRLPQHIEDVPRMQKNKILLDGGAEQGGGYLLQIFTNTVIGPIFFEIIQRKGNDGFGEGNFQALFDSIELDQIRRGVINIEEKA